MFNKATVKRIAQLEHPLIDTLSLLNIHMELGTQPHTLDVILDHELQYSLLAFAEKQVSMHLSIVLF